jgi:hypothetical protein
VIGRAALCYAIAIGCWDSPKHSSHVLKDNISVYSGVRLIEDVEIFDDAVNPKTEATGADFVENFGVWSGRVYFNGRQISSSPKVALRRCQVNRRSWKMMYPARQAPACQLQAPSLSATDHCPRRLAVFSLPAELAAGRRASGRAWYHRFVRNHSLLGQEVRATICPTPEAEAAEPKRCLASGRGCHRHRWKEAL